MSQITRLASWNVNSLKVRLSQVQYLLQSENLDILALQETKMTDEVFPQQAFQELGYNVNFIGQKTYNGVAIISREQQSELVTSIKDFADPQKRVIAATIGNLRLINLYIPNGSSVTSDKYNYKLAWLEAVTKYLAEQVNLYPNLAVVGDFNIAPKDIDVHDIHEWQDDVLVSKPERAALQTIFQLNLHDSFRELYPEQQEFSWWDYRAASFRRNRGLRIDLILLSAKLLHNCKSSIIHREFRKLERPSDHAPIITEFTM